MAKVSKSVPAPQQSAPSDASSEKAASPLTKAQLSSAPSPESIAKRAYEIFLARGGNHGHDSDDWAQAERELKLGRQ